MFDVTVMAPDSRYLQMAPGSAVPVAFWTFSTAQDKIRWVWAVTVFLCFLHSRFARVLFQLVIFILACHKY